MNGIPNIQKTFENTRREGRAALMPYLTLGYPDYMTSLDLVEAMARSGADLIELGVPFSDPLADGPTIQRSTQIALQNGMNLGRCLQAVTEIRARGVHPPLLLMGYYNPILAFGPGRFVREAAAAGADGMIIPDLPYDEADEIRGLSGEQNLAQICKLAPTSTSERIQGACEGSTGFLYLVSLRGVTGARSGLPGDLAQFVGRVRKRTRTPLAVGFGIGTPEQARDVGRLADGVIVGSAVISAAGQARPVEAVSAFVQSLAEALHPGR